MRSSGLREVGEGDGINVDLAEPGDVAKFFDAADAFLGGLDIAVINAAIPAEALAETGDEDLRLSDRGRFHAYLSTHQGGGETHEVRAGISC